MLHAIAVIPVHNEAATIGPIVAYARQYLPVIVIDDASRDGSAACAAKVGATVITLPHRQGKGAALRHGFAVALRQAAEVVVTLDGDGQHNPQDIPRLLAASRVWPHSLIIGNRLTTPMVVPRHRLYAIRLASFWISWMSEENITDTQSGFRVYPARVLRTLHLRWGGFLLESELLLKATQAGWRVREMPIRALYPPGQTSHYRPVRDGLPAALYLFYCGLCFWPRQLQRLYRALHEATRASDRQQVWRRTWVAGLATGVLPLLGLLLLVQGLLGRMGLDVLAPIMRVFYNQRLLFTPLVERKVVHDRQRRQWKCI
jgi:glycosyltransferase involved in cell wall biosynthesis